MTTTTAQGASADPSQGDTLNRGMITVSIMLATIMQALDTTIANVALPHMQGTLSATQDQISWVLTSYIVAAAIMTPPTGFLATRLGRKRLFLLSVTGFTIASVLCGIAATLNQMVLFRLLQGVFGAGLVPLSQAVLLDTYPREKHGSAMALWGIGIMLGPILGPSLGGWLTEYYNWRWVFFINVPFGILAWTGIATFVPDSEPDRRRIFDFVGFAFLSVSVGALQLMLDRGEQQDWFSSGEIVVEAIVAGLAFYMFLVHMLTHHRPFIDARIFRDRNFSAGLVFIFIVGVILLATLALLPPFLQQLLGYPVVTTGLVLAPRGMGTMVAMLIVGRLVDKTDPRYLIFTGLCFTAYSLWEMSNFTLGISSYDLITTGLMQGLGLGFIFVPLSTITFSTLAPHFRVEGSSLFSLMRNIGSSIGISIVVTRLAQGTQEHHAILSEYVTPFARAMTDGRLPDALNPGSAQGLAKLNSIVTTQAASISYFDDFRFMAGIVLLAFPLLLILKRPQHQKA